MELGEFKGFMDYLWFGVSAAFFLIIIGLLLTGIYRYLFKEFNLIPLLLAGSGLCFFFGVFTGNHWLFIPLAALCVAVGIYEGFTR